MKYSIIDRINASTLGLSLSKDDDFCGTDLDIELSNLVFCDIEEPNSIISEDDERFLLKATNTEAYEYFLLTIIERLNNK